MSEFAAIVKFCPCVKLFDDTLNPECNKFTTSEPSKGLDGRNLESKLVISFLIPMPVLRLMR